MNIVERYKRRVTEIKKIQKERKLQKDKKIAIPFWVRFQPLKLSNGIVVWKLSLHDFIIHVAKIEYGQAHTQFHTRLVPPFLPLYDIDFRIKVEPIVQLLMTFKNSTYECCTNEYFFEKHTSLSKKCLRCDNELRRHFKLIKMFEQRNMKNFNPFRDENDLFICPDDFIVIWTDADYKFDNISNFNSKKCKIEYAVNDKIKIGIFNEREYNLFISQGISRSLRSSINKPLITFI